MFLAFSVAVSAKLNRATIVRFDLRLHLHPHFEHFNRAKKRTSKFVKVIEHLVLSSGLVAVFLAAPIPSRSFVCSFVHLFFRSFFRSFFALLLVLSFVSHLSVFSVAFHSLLFPFSYSALDNEHILKGPVDDNEGLSNLRAVFAPTEGTKRLDGM